ncbi:hypothetical protein AB0L57_30340 [Nocardia sp. NPDC052254]|uniref:hypothetical protein n=1 Tax=Nocardia sp. NPDC052254 TaxID=3155681 RepID=UPI0034423CDF
MGQSNPWQKSRTGHRQEAPRPQPSDSTATRTRLPSIPSGTAGYLCGGIGSLVVFALMFRPWLTAGGWDGRAEANAFGQIHASTTYLNIWSKSGPRLAQLTSVWPPLIVVAVTSTVFTVLLIMRGAGSRPIHIAATTSTVAVAVSVVFDVLHLQSKGPDLKAMVGLGGDLGSQAGLVYRALSGKGRYPMPGSTVDSYANAGLTGWALTACALAIVSAAAALAQWNHNRRPAGSPAADRGRSATVRVVPGSGAEQVR